MSKPLSKWSQHDLADALGDANAERKAAESREKSLKDEIKRRGLHGLQGTRYQVNVTATDRNNLDTARLKEEKPKTYANYLRLTLYTYITVSAVTEDA